MLLESIEASIAFLRFRSAMLNRLSDRLQSVRVILVLIGMTSLITLFAADIYYAASAPTQPHPEYGAVYPVRIHQSTVYLTETQHYFDNGWLLFVAATCIAAVIIPEFIKRWKSGVWQDPPWWQRPDDD